MGSLRNSLREKYYCTRSSTWKETPTEVWGSEKKKTGGPSRVCYQASYHCSQLEHDSAGKPWEAEKSRCSGLSHLRRDEAWERDDNSLALLVYLSCVAEQAPVTRAHSQARSCGCWQWKIRPVFRETGGTVRIWAGHLQQLLLQVQEKKEEGQRIQISLSLIFFFSSHRHTSEKNLIVKLPKVFTCSTKHLPAVTCCDVLTPLPQATRFEPIRCCLSIAGLSTLISLAALELITSCDCGS